MSRPQATGLVLCVVLGVFSSGCDRCPSETPLRTTVRVHVPHPALVPRHCPSGGEGPCRPADHVAGLVYSFVFDQRAEGRLWCSYPDPPGVFRTQSCAPAEVVIPQPANPSEGREFLLVVEECDLATLAPPQEGDACGVLTRPSGLPIDSCGEALFCRSSDSRCAALPEGCTSDGDCSIVEVCDETHLCVRFACDTEASECVWPDECLDTSDCQRSHSRCDPVTGRCDTFTCETGRCVGVSPAGGRAYPQSP